MDVLKTNPRKIPGLGPIVSYTTGANCVFIIKDQGKSDLKGRSETNFENKFAKNNL